jgi:hypothetical protein
MRQLSRITPARAGPGDLAEGLVKTVTPRSMAIRGLAQPGRRSQHFAMLANGGLVNTPKKPKFQAQRKNELTATDLFRCFDV